MAVAGETRLVELNNGHRVWTRRVGDSGPKVLTLHGGPGFSHEYFEIFEKYLPQAGFTFYYYDQLGSYFSDQPDDKSLWQVERFREEVEEVRRALGLEDFLLYGQSWGGMLTIEYALKYQQHLRAAVISNMTASIPACDKHLGELRARLPLSVQQRLEHFEGLGQFDAPEYQEIVTRELYRRHICRLDPWPDAVQRCFDHLAMPVYGTMQGPNEFFTTGNFRNWDRWADLDRIRVPTLLIVGRHDSMRPGDIAEMAGIIPDSELHVLENGSHLSMWDDEQAYFQALIPFLRRVSA